MRRMLVTTVALAALAAVWSGAAWAAPPGGGEIEVRPLTAPELVDLGIAGGKADPSCLGSPRAVQSRRCSGTIERCWGFTWTNQKSALVGGGRFTASTWVCGRGAQVTRHGASWISPSTWGQCTVNWGPAVYYRSGGGGSVDYEGRMVIGCYVAFGLQDVYTLWTVVRMTAWGTASIVAGGS